VALCGTRFQYPEWISPLEAIGRLQYVWSFGVLLQCGIKGPQQFLLHSMWDYPDNASHDNRKHHNQRRIVASPDVLLPEQRGPT
jgi:hypothetical protein